jgi:predicted ATPase/DNA-binding CsgD family transcriptional regulator
VTDVQREFSSERPLRLVTADTVPPPALTPRAPIVGRRSEVERVLAAVDRGSYRVVTITGLGGIGKTRIAQEVGRRLWEAQHPAPAAVLFIPLGGVATADEVAGAILAASGWATPDAADVDQLESVKRELHGRRFVLILDNCEQIGGLSDLVEHLVSVLADLTVIVTSRRPLGLAAELCVPIGPLGTPGENDYEVVMESEAVVLLVQAVQQRDPGFSVDRSDAAAVGELCRRLDGIPLALQLAAARLHHISAHELIALLDRRFDLLRATDGEQLLAATIDWSYQALGPEDRRRFRMLGVFPETFGLAGAAAVAGCDPIAMLDTLQTLERYAFANVAERGRGATRFAMLETLRAFALDRLADADETDTALAALSTWCEELVSGASDEPASEGQRFLEFDRELANIRAALDWSIGAGAAPERVMAIAADLWRYWINRGRAREGLRTLRAALEIGPGSGRPTARALIAGGELAIAMFDLSSAVELYDGALEAWAAVGDEHGLADARNSLAVVLRELGQLDRAEGLHHEALAYFRASESTRYEASALNGLGAIAYKRGDPVQAAALWQQALERVELLGDLRSQAAAVGNIGIAKMWSGELPAALAAYTRGLELAGEIGDRTLTLTTLINRAEAYIAAGECDAAMLDLDQAVPLVDEVGMLLAHAIIAHHRALLAERNGHLGEAIRHHLDGMKRTISLGNPLEATEFAEELARLTAELHEHHIARRCLASTRAIRATTGTTPSQDLEQLARALGLPDHPELMSDEASITEVLAGLTDELQLVATTHADASRAAEPAEDPLLGLGLSAREADVARLLVEHKTDPEIAAELFIGVRTVGSHVSSILRKLAVTSRREVATKLADAGVDLGSS